MKKPQPHSWLGANMAAVPLLLLMKGIRQQLTRPLSCNSKSRREVKREEEERWEKRRGSDKGWIPCSRSLTATMEQSSPICLVGRYASQSASWAGSFQRQELKCFTQVTVDRPSTSAFQSFPASASGERRRDRWCWWSRERERELALVLFLLSHRFIHCPFFCLC